MKVKARHLKQGDIIRFTDPNSPDQQIDSVPIVEPDRVFCMTVTYNDDGLPDTDTAVEFIFGNPDSEEEVVYRGRQYVHPGISTMDDGDDLSLLNKEFQLYAVYHLRDDFPRLREMISRLNKLVSPDA